MSDRGDMLKLLNASGYAFQLAVESLVASQRIDGVEVAAREHPWVHEQSQRSGFIDLIIEKHLLRLVVECKRTTDANWLFLMPADADANVHDFHCLWSMYFEPNVPASEWDREPILPPSASSQFCCVRGSGEGQVAAIDRIGAELIYAAEALAKEERARIPEHAYTDYALRYIPVIVTNAGLAVAKFDPKDVDLATGKLSNCEVMPVDLVRYRKAMDPLAVVSTNKARSTRESNKLSQRSIFVVNAAAIPHLLAELGTVQSGFDGPPWRIAVNRYKRQR
jgi:hypothetical protein